MSSRPGSLHPLLCVSLFILIAPSPDFVRQNVAAQQSHRDACFALTAWYLVGSPGVLPQSDTEAYLWARRAAEAGLVKAMYAVGYFLEVGIGTPSDMKEWVYAPHFDGNHSLTLGSPTPQGNVLVQTRFRERRQARDTAAQNKLEYSDHSARRTWICVAERPRW